MVDLRRAQLEYESQVCAHPLVVKIYYGYMGECANTLI